MHGSAAGNGCSDDAVCRACSGHNIKITAVGHAGCTDIEAGGSGRSGVTDDNRAAGVTEGTGGAARRINIDLQCAGLDRRGTSVVVRTIGHDQSACAGLDERTGARELPGSAGRGALIGRTAGHAHRVVGYRSCVDKAQIA